MRRKESRKPLALNAVCRTVSDRTTVAISNISSKGCRITGDYVYLAVDQKIVLRPEGLEGLTGVVRWFSELGAGIEFDHPLHRAVVDHLCERHPDNSHPIAVEIAA